MLLYLRHQFGTGKQVYLECYERVSGAQKTIYGGQFTYLDLNEWSIICMNLDMNQEQAVSTEGYDIREKNFVNILRAVTVNATVILGADHLVISRQLKGKNCIMYAVPVQSKSTEPHVVQRNQFFTQNAYHPTDCLSDEVDATVRKWSANEAKSEAIRIYGLWKKL